MLFTTSWDDGYALDLRVSELLSKYGSTGTFYVCPNAQHGENMLTEAQVKTLSMTHEIGAHTLTHPKLTKISATEALEELSGSKQWVERVTGKPCTQFCYPYGDENGEVRALVKEAGFARARTTERLGFRSTDPYRMPITVQLLPFPWRRSFKPKWKILDPFGPLRVSYPMLRLYRVPLWSLRSWLTMATALFDGAIERGEPFFHLYGHSRELQKFDLWEDLEKFLAHVQKSGVRSVPNSAL